jgi:prenyltransferase beta subunit
VERRIFLSRGTGALLGLASTGLTWRALAQDGAQARGMITERTQQYIDAGLAYLAANQHADGSFGTNQYHGNVAVTALGGLALMAGGHQPGRGRYGRNVTHAVEHILNCEDRRQHPGFLTNQQAAFHGPMYGHGFATLFLAEVYGMVNKPELRNKLRDTLHRAVGLIISAQNNEGGWRYRPIKADADLSVTICQIMALRAARNAGVAVPKKVADDCIKYVKDCQDLHRTGGFRYQRHSGAPGFARTAAGLVALYSAGVYEGESVEKGLDYLKQFQPGSNKVGGIFANAEVQMHYYYGHYYAVQAMWIAGGDYWRAWYPAIRDELLASFRQNGQTGFWQMGIMCPHYCTAMALIILQVPNNYLPILQR